MSIRSTLEEALERGEKIKEQVMMDLLNSPMMNSLMQNEVFLKSLTKVLNTKYEMKRALKHNFKGILKALNVPSRDEMTSMTRKLHRLESELDGIHRKILTNRLSHSHETTPVKATRKAKGTKKKKATRAKRK